MVTIEYRCADGTPFPVDFASEEQASRTWRIEREHLPEPMTPLEESVSGLARGSGARAYTDLGVDPPDWFGTGVLRPHGFSYFEPQGENPELIAKIGNASRTLLQSFSSAASLWTEHCLPLAKETCRRIREDATLSIADIAQLGDYALQLTMVPMTVCSADMFLLTATCRGIFGDAAELRANELAQGFGNETLRADQELWSLAQLVRESPRLAKAIEATDPRAAMDEVRADGADADFFDALDRFIEAYGWRTEWWSISAPMWRERGDGFWAQLRRLGRDDATSPSEATARGARRRDELVAEAERLLADNPDELARFRRRVDRVRAYVAVREERALWQLVTTGSQRYALQHRGDALVQSGATTTRDDVFFLTAEEVEGPGAAGDLARLIAARRAEHQRRRALVPPAVIGGATAPDAGDGSSRTELQGVAGSRGTVTARARVIVDLAEADRLEPGEVLVCRMTAPPWTPLFGIASAVVVDSGSIGSHPAIAAREYGIPCVLSTLHGTSLIPDGALITVDGEKGTVRLEEAPG